MESPASYLPIRIGAIVPDGGLTCVGCGPEPHSQQPHIQPRFRFILLVYMPVVERVPPAMAYAMPFIGGPHTPPVEINGVQTAGNPQVTERFIRFLNWN